MTEADSSPEAPQEYARFDTGAEFQRCVDRLLTQDGRELRVFDSDLSVLKLNSTERIGQLRAFLSASPTRRVYMVVHNPDHVTRFCPRLLELLRVFSHAVQINRTSEEIRELQDSFMVLDRNHYVRRPVGRFFRGACGFNDESQALIMRTRFQEIWNASLPAVSTATTGL
jgi:hypothetical protein